MLGAADLFWREGRVSTMDPGTGSRVGELASLGEKPREGWCLPALLAAKGTERR